MIRLQNGKDYEPKDDDPVHCDLHNVTVRWGDLTPIQQLAVEEGIDIDTECILLPEKKSHAVSD